MEYLVDDAKNRIQNGDNDKAHKAIGSASLNSGEVDKTGRMLRALATSDAPEEIRNRAASDLELGFKHHDDKLRHRRGYPRVD
ncbi:MAG: hypothetical protein ACLFPV_11890 [Spirochaetaceae bacterium]